MQNRRVIILVLSVAGVLTLFTFLLDWKYITGSLRDILIADIQNRQLVEINNEKEDMLKVQLRIAQKQIESMNRVIKSTKELPDCEVIHIAVVCTSHAAARDVVILIKSILFSRKHPLHFHFVSDSSTINILTYMFKTWDIPSVTVSYYSTDTIQNECCLKYRNIVDKDNLYKLILPMILPKEFDKVILLDPDIIVNRDIAELWKLFDAFDDEKAIAAVENQNSWYLERLKKNKRESFILGKGINLSVLLYDLKKLRTINFTEQVKATTVESIIKRFSFQDIFNAVLKHNANILQLLPNKWNLQLNENSTIDLCSNNVVSKLKIVQGYSLNSISLKGGCTSVYRKLHNSFLELSGNLLKRQLSACKTSLTFNDQLSLVKEDTDGCLNFRIQQNNIFRTHLYFIEYDYKPKPNDVTMVTQMTLERLVLFQQMCEHWDGPISIAIHLTDTEAYELLNFVKKSFLQTRKNIGYHIVYKEGSTGLYPYNYLRNVALENVQTPYVFLNDIDLIPVIGMYQRLRNDVLNKMDIKHKKVALVVPAFEQTQLNLKFPKNKQMLLMQMKKKQIVRFKFYKFPKGQNATDYPKWIMAKAAYKVHYRAYYEPYMILPKDMPKYDTRFVGWGWDKTSHTIELDATGYEFVVLPDLFIIHISHTQTYHRIMFAADKTYYRCVQYFKDEFLNHFTVKYGQRGQFYKKMFKDYKD